VPKTPGSYGRRTGLPSEDIGGIPGYEHFLEAINYPLSEEHAELLNWYGSKTFDPDFF